MGSTSQPQMSEMKSDPQPILPGHLLVELTSLDELCFPTSFSHRMKYTCITASPKHLAVGCTSGSVYLFPRYVSKLHRPSISNFPVQVIACKEGSVVALKICPHEKFIGVSTNRGVVTVVSLGRSHAQVVQTVTLNPEASITALCWTKDSSRLLAGDNLGKLHSVRMAHNLTSAYFKTANDQLVATLDGPIVQIDHWDPLCLVSTWSKSVLINLTTGKLTGIGRKLRMAPHGGCFLPPSSVAENKTTDPTVICSRPNARLWEVDLTGNVYSTHHFAAATSLPTCPIVTFRSNFQWPPKLPSSLQFYAVSVLKNEFLLCATQCHLVAIDPRKAKIRLICDIGEEIAEFCCSNADVFVLTRDGSLRKFTFFTVEKAILKLHIKRELSLCAQLLHTYFLQSSRTVLDCNWPSELFNDVLAHAQTNESSQVAESIQMLASLYTKRKKDSLRAKIPAIAKLSSGIHKVMDNSGYEDDFNFDSTLLLKSRQQSLLVDPSRSKSLFQLPLTNSKFTQRSSQSAFSWEQSGQRPTRSRDDSETRLRTNGHSARLSSCNAYSDASREPLSNGASDLHCMKLMTSSRSEGALLQLLDEEGIAPAATPEDDEDLDTLSVLSSTDSDDKLFVEEKTPQDKVSRPLDKVVTNCQRCGLHSSWQSVLSLGPLCSDPIPISPFDYIEGGIPFSVKQWKELLMAYHHLKTSPESNEIQLCPNCQHLFDHYLKCCNRVGPMSSRTLSQPQVVSKAVKPQWTSSQTAGLFIGGGRKQLDSQTAETAAKLRPPSKSPLKLTPTESSGFKMDFSMYYNPAYLSTNGSETPLGTEEISRWTWLSSVPLETLMATAIRQVGLAESLKILADFEAIQSDRLSTEFCQFLINETTKDPRQHNHLPTELLPSLFKDFQWQMDSFSGDATVASKTASVISMHSDCPCCTLPLSCRVSESQDLLLLFNCGHAYHKVCYPVELDKRAPNSCIVCSTAQ